METGTLLGVGALIVSAAGALNSMRTGRREDRSGAFTEMKDVVKTLKEENERLEKKMDDAEADCRVQIAGCNDLLKEEREKRRQLQDMFNQQAERIAELERMVKRQGR